MLIVRDGQTQPVEVTRVSTQGEWTLAHPRTTVVPAADKPDLDRYQDQRMQWVEIWLCDAAGMYSEVSNPGFDTQGQNFLRGYQVTDENGAVQFTTIYPGGYSGQTANIHVKIRTEKNRASI